MWEFFSTKRLRMAGVGVVVVGVVVASLLALPQNSREIYDSAQIARELRLHNPHFAAAQSAYARKEYDAALTGFESAYRVAAHGPEREVISTFIVRAYTAQDRITEAVEYLMHSASNTEYSLRARAEAVESIAILYHTTRDPRISQALFVAKPYSVFIDEEPSERDAYNRVFEYAASLYPLPVSGYRTAQMYAEKLLRQSQYQSESENPALRSARYLAKVREAQARADAELAAHPALYIKDKENLLARRAELSGVLFRAGYRVGVHPEDLYRDILSRENSAPGARGFVLLHYALFVAAVGEGRRDSEVQQILAPLYETTAFEGSTILTFLRNIKDVATTTNPGVLELVRIDPKFKAFLIEKLQWSPSV